MNFSDLRISAIFETLDFLVVDWSFRDIHSFPDSFACQIMGCRSAKDIFSREVVIITVDLIYNVKSF